MQVFKTTADPFVGRLTYFRVLSGTLQSQDHVWNADTRRGRAHRPGAAPPRQGAGAGRRAACRRDRRGRQARRDGHGRHAVTTREPRSTSPPHRLPRADPAGGHRAVSPRPTSTRWAPALQRMLEEDPTVRVERQRDRRAAPVGAGREPDRRDHRAAQAQVRRRRSSRARRGPLSRDHPRQDAGRRPAQEADRRPRPVRRRLAGDRAQPGRGVEFAEKVVGGSVPRQFFAGVEKGVREIAAEGVLAGYPGDRLQGDALRRLVPHRRLGRAVVPDRRVDGAQGRHPAGASRSCSSRSWRSRSACPRRTWATSTATSTPAADACWAWTSEDGHAGHHGARAAGRAVHVRHGAAVTHRRPRHVQRRASTTTRTCRRTSRTRSSRRTRRTTPRVTEPAGAAD